MVSTSYMTWIRVLAGEGLALPRQQQTQKPPRLMPEKISVQADFERTDIESIHRTIRRVVVIPPSAVIAIATIATTTIVLKKQALPRAVEIGRIPAKRTCFSL